MIIPPLHCTALMFVIRAQRRLLRRPSSSSSVVVSLQLRRGVQLSESSQVEQSKVVPSRAASLENCPNSMCPAIISSAHIASCHCCERVYPVQASKVNGLSRLFRPITLSRLSRGVIFIVSAFSGSKLKTCVWSVRISITRQSQVQCHPEAVQAASTS